MNDVLQEALERLVAIEVEALASLPTPVTADAKPYMIHTQEAFPYFTNRVGTITVESDSHDYDTTEVELIGRLVIGHLTDGYRGQPEKKLYTYLPALLKTVNARELLQCAAFPDALLDLVQARATGSPGLRIFETAGVQARQVGTEITVVCTFMGDLTQDYL